MVIKSKLKSLDSQTLIPFRCNLGFQAVLKPTMKASQYNGNKIRMLIVPRTITKLFLTEMLILTKISNSNKNSFNNSLVILVSNLDTYLN